jgi:predicted ABC-class ATPase
VVVGGVGDYLDVADRVVLLENYVPSDVTDRAREVTRRFPPHAPLADRGVHLPKGRRLRMSSVDLGRGKRGRETARGRGLQAIELSRERVDLSYLEQLAEAGQTEAIARLVGRFVAGGGGHGIRELVEEALTSVSEGGLSELGGFGGHPGEMSLPRGQEVAATINRIRSLGVIPYT